MMEAAYDAEQAGQTPVIGSEAGTARTFCTEDDMNLYDWGHTRVIYDFSKPFSDGGLLDSWTMMAKIMAGRDARSTAESYANECLAKLQELGLGSN